MTRRHFFAPGVIEAPHRPALRTRVFQTLDRLVNFVLHRVWLIAALSLALGFAVGLLRSYI